MAKERVRVEVRLTQEEKEFLLERVERFGFVGMSDYIRKMCVENGGTGIILQADLSPLREIATNLHRTGALLNRFIQMQMDGQRIYDVDLEEIREIFLRVECLTEETLGQVEDIFYARSQPDVCMNNKDFRSRFAETFLKDGEKHGNDGNHSKTE